MTIPRRVVQPPPHGLTPGVVYVLLLGWSAVVPGEAPGTDDAVFELFLAGHAGIAKLWTRHEAYLRSEASRLSIAPQWSRGGKKLFFGEFVIRDMHAARVRAATAQHVDDNDLA